MRNPKTRVANSGSQGGGMKKCSSGRGIGTRVGVVNYVRKRAKCPKGVMGTPKHPHTTTAGFTRRAIK
jgi:hypothetical protein